MQPTRPDLPASSTYKGFRIDVEAMTDPNDPERGTWVDCWLSKASDSASLAVAEDTGELNEGTKVPDSVAAHARSFAEKYGY